MRMTDNGILHQYIGKELDLFAEAINWKLYISAKIIPLLGHDVMEVGAGIGSNTIALCSVNQTRWLCIEPDATLLTRLTNKLNSHPALSMVETRLGTIDHIHDNEFFDTILYIDVLEHIKNDKLELERAGKFLRHGGRLIVISPAYQWLYCPFDHALGHFRRYSKRTLSALTPPSLTLENIHYIDSAGLIASMGNFLFLRKALPTAGQISFWDKFLVSISVRLDTVLRYKFGKTIIAFWKKD